MSKYVNESLPKEQRLGQVGVNNQGEKITIITYRKYEDIDIQFEDGVIVYHRSYDNFIRGKMKHPIKYEESIAYYIEVELGIDLDIIWNWEKNKCNPYETEKQSNKKIWIYCQEKDYHNDFGGYEITCYNFTKGQRCGYCASRKVHLKDSFAQWGIDTFGEDFLEKYWSSKNTVNPWKISSRSHTEIWIYCQEHDYHNYDREGNKIGYKTRCDSFYIGSRCSYCNTFASNKVHWKDSLAYVLPKVARMISEVPKNKVSFEDCYSIAPYSSNKRFYFKCLDCGKISSKKQILSNITKHIYSCEYCSDGITIPNKMLRQISEQLNLNWKFEHGEKWLGRKRLDAYDENFKIAVEMDAEYKDNHKDERKEVDDWKDSKCLEHGIYVIRIDLMDTKEYNNNTLDYIRTQLINSSLTHIIDLSKVNWELAWVNCQNSLCVKTWELWNDSIKNIAKISRILNLSEPTVTRYLKIGAELGKCDYVKKRGYNDNKIA